MILHSDTLKYNAFFYLLEVVSTTTSDLSPVTLSQNVKTRKTNISQVCPLLANVISRRNMATIMHLSKPCVYINILSLWEYFDLLVELIYINKQIFMNEKFDFCNEALSILSEFFVDPS